jgi:hypothetical protein
MGSHGERFFSPWAFEEVTAYLILDNPLAPFGGEGGERSEPGEGFAKDFDCQELSGTPPGCRSPMPMGEDREPK